MNESLAFGKTLRNFSKVPGLLRRQVEEFLDGGSRAKTYLPGRNLQSRKLSRCIDIDGFVDDFAPQCSLRHDGKPVIKMADLEALH